MEPAIFGIENDGLNLAVNLLVLVLVVLWIALVYWTFEDARRRLDDPVLIGSSIVASLFPFVGTLAYSIVRPPEYLEDVQERDMETQAAELRLAELKATACPRCEHRPIHQNFLLCPACGYRLKAPCPSCSRPVAIDWRVCPFCEVPLRRRKSSGERRARRQAPPGAEEAREVPESREAGGQESGRGSPRSQRGGGDQRKGGGQRKGGPRAQKGKGERQQADESAGEREERKRRRQATRK